MNLDIVSQITDSQVKSPVR